MNDLSDLRCVWDLARDPLDPRYLDIGTNLEIFAGVLRQFVVHAKPRCVSWSLHSGSPSAIAALFQFQKVCRALEEQRLCNAQAQFFGGAVTRHLR